MEPRDRAPQEVRTPRVRVVAWSAVLVAIAFAQAPGRTVADTKLDLVVDPWRFLGRALTLWDAEGSFGQVQNQAYGYLFPMGPFFGVLHSAGVPPWVAQRAWWALVLVVAFVGVVLLLEALDVGVGWTRILAALAFALSPRMISVVGPSSIEVWPSALAPWVLLPLVVATRRGGDPRRLAAFSALGVLAVGGVNAVATFATVPLAALWIVLSPAGSRRRALLRWWPPLVLAASLWWILPLLLLGRYSPPFLDYIESISNTSFAATVLDAMRGSTNWVAYVSADSDAGRLVITEPVVVLNGVVLVALGVAGLATARRDLRPFLLAGLGLGLVLVTLGHQGSTTGWGAGTWRELLDGSLSPLRNTHKFDPLVRLPLVVGLCIAVTRLTRPARDESSTTDQAVWRARWRDPLVSGITIVACVALVGSTSPAWTGRLPNRGTFDGVPAYWAQTARWLEDHGNGRALLVPASPFAGYSWGHTNDEPLQALARSPWAVRNVIPLTPPTTIDMLDTLERAWSSGQGSSGLATYLRRSGVGTVVLRHDLDRGTDVTSPEVARSTLLSTPGVRRVAELGPVVGGGPTLVGPDGRKVFVDEGRQAPRRAVEIFELGDPVAPSRTTAGSLVDTLVGGTDSLLRLNELGRTEGRESVLAQDVVSEDGTDSSKGRPTPGRLVLADGNRRQEVAFARTRDNRSSSLSADQPYRADRAVHRYDEAAVERWTTTPRLIGARSLEASSSLGDATAVPRVRQDAGPWAAFDGDPRTAWRPDGSADGKTSWLRLRLERATRVGFVRLVADQPPGRTTRVTVSTQDGPRAVTLVGRTPAGVDVGRVSTLEVRGRSSPAVPLALAEIRTGLTIARPLALPTLPPSWGMPDTVLLQGQPGAAGACALVSGVRRCSAVQQLRPEETDRLDRLVTLPRSASFAAQLRARAVGGSNLTALLQRGRVATVSASSQRTDDPADGPLAAIDGSSRTGWAAADDDPTPTVTFSWLGRRSVDRIGFRTSDQAVTPVARVTLRTAEGATRTAVVRGGVARFRAVRTSSLSMQLQAGTPAVSVGFDRALTRLPVGVSEISVPGVDQLRYAPSTRARQWPCGSGPSIRARGGVVRSALVASEADLLAGGPVATRACGDTGPRPGVVRLDRGTSRLVVQGSSVADPADLVLDRAGARSGSVDDPGPRDLVVRTHNDNAGWRAVVDGGRDAVATTASGSQQAWWVPHGSGAGLRAEFAPQRQFVVSLWLGLLLALVLLLLPWVRRSRQDEPVAEREPEGAGTGPLAAGLVCLVVAAAVAGVPGLAAAGAGAAVAGLVRRRAPAVGWFVPTILWSVAGLVAALRPWGGVQTWEGDLALTQLLVVAALGSLAVVVPSRRTQRASFRRRQGRSTRR